MRNGYFTILTSLLICIAALIGFNLLGALLVILFYGMDASTADPAGLILCNGVSQLLVLLGFPLLLSRGLHIDVRETTRIHTPTKSHIPLFLIAIPMTICAQLFGTALCSIWMDFLSLFPELYAHLLEVQNLMDDMMSKLVKVEDSADVLVMLAGVALIPAIAEEFFFRGFLFGHIERSEPQTQTIAAVVLTSLAFGASHMSPFNLPGLALLGALFSWMMVISRTIYIPMFAHFVNNAIIVVILYVFQNEPLMSKSLTGTTSIPPSQSLPILLFSSGALYLLAKVFNKFAGKYLIQTHE